MKTRHARAIRAGIITARQHLGWNILQPPGRDLAARAYWETWLRHAPSTIRLRRG